jgi:hypothetical protein
LDEGYLTLDDLEEQRALAGSLKHVIWLIPLFVVAEVALGVLGELGMLEVVAFAGIFAGLLVTAWGSARQEHRWEELIGETSTARGRTGSRA